MINIRLVQVTEGDPAFSGRSTPCRANCWSYILATQPSAPDAGTVKWTTNGAWFIERGGV